MTDIQCFLWGFVVTGAYGWIQCMKAWTMHILDPIMDNRWILYGIYSVCIIWPLGVYFLIESYR